MNLQFYRETIAHHGIGPTLSHAAYRAANRLAELVVWNALVITPDQVAPAFRRGALGQSAGHLVEAADMEAFLADPAYGLTEDFLVAAAARGDRCYAIFDHEKLASYSWYSTKPVRLMDVADQPVLHVDRSYVYTHSALTMPDYRGKRLHAIGMAAALEECHRDGAKGLLSSVNAANLPALKSYKRLGFETFGRVFMGRLRGERVCRATPGCRAYDFRVEVGAGAKGPRAEIAPSVEGVPRSQAVAG
jgi:GNAT superfamily N-acetyltransferase